MKQPKKILIIKHGAFGDLIQADGVIHDLRNFYPNDEFVLLTSSLYQSLMERSPYIDRIIIDNREPLWKLHKQWALFQKLKQEQFDLVIDLQISDRTRLYQKLVFPHTQWIGRPPTEPRPESAPRGHAALLAKNGIAVEYTMQPDISWMADDISELLKANHIQQPYIVLIPGSSAKHKQKRWPLFPKFAQILTAQGYCVINLTGPDEQDLAAQLVGHHLRPNGKFLNWFQIAGLLKSAAFVIGNDTGPSHIASCLGTPGFALFGPTSASRAEIARGAFGAIQVEDLATLSIETVMAKMNEEWPTNCPRPEQPDHS